LIGQQLLVDLAPLGKEQFLVVVAQVHEPHPHFIEQDAGEVELVGRQSQIGQC